MSKQHQAKRWIMCDAGGSAVVLSNEGVAGVTNDVKTYEDNGYGHAVEGKTKEAVEDFFNGDARFNNFDRGAFAARHVDA